MDRIKHLKDEIEFPKQGILSKTIHEAPSVPKGEKISAHTSSRDAAVFILQGEVDFTLGSETYRVKAGDWFFMEAGLVHALSAIEDLAFILTLFGSSN